MKYTIHAKDYKLSESLEQYIEKKLTGAFSRLDHLIQFIDLHLTDENGPKGGFDKGCLILVKTFDLPEIIIRDVETDAYAAISRAVSRAKRTLIRQHNLRQLTLKRMSFNTQFLDA